MMEILLFANSASQHQMREVAKALAQNTGLTVRIGKAEVGWHSDREPFIEILDNVRDKLVVVIASICPFHTAGMYFSVNDMQMQTMALLDALYRASAKILTVVVPYMGYLRQDRRSGAKTHRTAITAKLAAQQFTLAAEDLRHVCVIEPHTESIEGLFKCRFDAIPALHLFVPEVMKHYGDPETCVVFSPDKGGVPRATAYATHHGIKREPGHIVKRRPEPGVAKVVGVVGDVEGLNLIFVDDMLATFGTINEGTRAAKARGARSVTAVAPHGLLVGDALQKIDASQIDHVIIMDTIPPRPDVASHPKITVVSSAPLIAEAIQRHVSGESIRSIGFKDPEAAA